ncbi:hypothetical protein FACS1894202_01530 [Clostridia bacterium]|nr:hypothetical protein FACS1894202_01530 [Clostridia bacterium]
MATTRLIPLHVNKGKTLAQTIFDRTDYAKNPDKTERGFYVKGFECEPRCVDEQFLIAKREYDLNNGRGHAGRDVIAYQIRQSFRPGEITPEEALAVGYETALRFTKGRHQFIVAVHVDKKHIHSHAVFNSTALDCERKFKNFWGSAFALRRLSDLICVEHGLSIIENPKPSKGRNYGDWLQDKKEPSWSEKLRNIIDDVLPKCKTFDDFLAALKASGYEVKEHRKHVSVLAPGGGQYRRLDTLKGDYTEEAIRSRLGKPKVIASGGDSGTHTRVNLLIDIQAKIQEGKGAGYENWAKIFNLREAARTLIFLQEQGIDSYDNLKLKASSASGGFAALNKKIRETEARMAEVTELQKYIGQYGKTRTVYEAYKKSGWSRKFYDEHVADILLHKAAKNYFDRLSMKKLPSITSLKQEWATLNSEKKSLYAGYRQAKETSRQLSVALGNANQILGFTPAAQTVEPKREAPKRDAHEI